MRPILNLCTAWLLHAPAYQSGAFLHHQHRRDVAHEHGFYVTVPVDHRDPNAGTTEVYVRTVERFDLHRPSLIYFEGGPGFDCHYDPSALRAHAAGYNIVMFDPRGVMFSKPFRRDLYESNAFYSSETTARDVDVIRRALNIDRWAVVGQSYGTLAATIYASWYPERSVSLTLLATLFGRGTLEPSRGRMLAYHRRSPALRRVREVMAEDGLGPGDALDGDGEAKLLDQWIEETIYVDGTYALPSLATRLVRAQRESVPAVKAVRTDREGLDREVMRRQIENEPDLSAAAYPVRVPTTYVHGTADVRTPARPAIRHFKTVAHGFRQLVLFKGIGHRVLRTLGTADADGALPVTAFADALAGRDLRIDPAHAAWLASGSVAHAVKSK